MSVSETDDYGYLTCCVDCAPEDSYAIQAMRDGAEEVPFAEMFDHCDGLLEWSESVGYETNPAEGLCVENDHHVAFYRGTFKGEPVYFLVWSAIEFIWTRFPNGESENFNVKETRRRHAEETGDRIAHPGRAGRKVATTRPGDKNWPFP